MKMKRRDEKAKDEEDEEENEKARSITSCLMLSGRAFSNATEPCCSTLLHGL